MELGVQVFLEKMIISASHTAYTQSIQTRKKQNSSLSIDNPGN